MVRLARLSGHRDRSLRRLSVGVARAPRSRVHVLAAGACFGHSAARRAHAANARRRVSRLSGAHERILSVAVTRNSGRDAPMNITAAALGAGEKGAWRDRLL